LDQHVIENNSISPISKTNKLYIDTNEISMDDIGKSGFNNRLDQLKSESDSQVALPSPSFRINFEQGDIDKEKNIEEILECCLALNEKYNFNLNIIGNGPFIDNLKDIIDIKFKKIKNKIIFLGSKESIEINTIYQTLVNRIFIFTSLSETFGKTPMEAGATGIPIFIKESEITENLYINKKNAFIFKDSKSFVQLFDYFVSLDNIAKQLLINNSINNIKKYDQNVIFNDWLDFLSEGIIKKENQKINLIDMLSFYGMAKLINCSGSVFGD